MSTLPEEGCRGPYTPPPSCSTAGDNFSPPSCEDLGVPDCIYASAGSIIPMTAPCELTGDSTGSHATRGQGLGPGYHLGGTTYQPYFCVHFVDDAQDGDGNSNAFFGREAMTDFLTSSLTIAVDPCGPEEYCGVGAPHAIWMSRMLLEDANGWAMICNKVEKCATPPCEQHIVKPLTVDGLDVGVSILTLATDTAPHCFGPTTHHFCLLAVCTDDYYGKIMNCVGDTFSYRADAVDRLFVSLSCRYGDDTTFADTTTTELMNAMWSALDESLDQLDAPGHSALLPYDSPNLRKWNHAEDFGDTHIINIDVGGTIDGQTFQILVDEEVIAEYVDTTESAAAVIAGLVTSWNLSSNPLADNITATGFDEYLQLAHAITGETFDITLNTPGSGAVFFQTEVQEGSPDPIVQGTASYYSEYSGVDIPITLQGSCSGSVYTTQATLRLQSVVVTVDLMAEKLISDNSLRITGGILISLRVRVQRDAEATGKFNWLNPSNRYDLRLEDPDDLGNEHPRERILATGPNGERVWRQDGAGADGYLHTWEGLKAPQTHSKGPNTFDEFCASVTGLACCGFLQTVNGLVIHGRTNDNTGLEDRFKITRCFVGGTLSGETFTITLSDGYDDQIIAQHTDTTGNIADAVTALVAAFNASSETFAADVMASEEYNAVKLTPDHSEVPMYDVILSVTAGDATFVTSIEYFSELPQYYEGSVSFGTGDDPSTVGCGC